MAKAQTEIESAKQQAVNTANQVSGKVTPPLNQQALLLDKNIASIKDKALRAAAEKEKKKLLAQMKMVQGVATVNPQAVQKKLNGIQRQLLQTVVKRVEAR